VVKIETTLDPFGLMERIQTVQRDAGRIKDTIRFGPRILDLDIIFFDDIVLHSEYLIIPHPRMHKRRFVLKPLCDIDPGIMHPVINHNVQTLLDNLDDSEQRISEYI
jgi:2-amino-4-hydroxy-6-hydroxymethyldihydropteridine diphosphokinase